MSVDVQVDGELGDPRLMTTTASSYIILYNIKLHVNKLKEEYVDLTLKLK